MKISYDWLKQYIDTSLSAEAIAEKLTAAGLEVESIEHWESLKGGLKGVVIGEVKTKTKHPDADRLSVTTVDIGAADLLNIVCGAPNVEAGQKVAVATIGTTLYTSSGETLEMKKSKIRGVISEGMICAEDEIGLGTSHAGIMVLNPAVQVGTPAADYFGVVNDKVFEIGLTPNRADATSHIGVARDLTAIQNFSADLKTEKSVINWPNVNDFTKDNDALTITVKVEDAVACPRYCGVTLTQVKVQDSPDWLKNRLLSIGLRPINNVVDITNYVLHETGQPLHAFDADKIKGKTVLVKKLAKDTPFVTLDGVTRKLSEHDLMICNASDPMCIAGVFGGLDSGVSAQTTNIFLESAYFDAVHIRRSSRFHGLKTDASFRFERGTDPEMTIYALKRAAQLIKEIAGASISCDIVDLYPAKLAPFAVRLDYEYCNRLIGKIIEPAIIKNILGSLGIQQVSEDPQGLNLSVPRYKVDVQRPADVVEEILRIYGYNNVEIPTQVRASLSYAIHPDSEKLRNLAGDWLSSQGFTEIMSTSLTKSAYTDGLSSIDATKNIQLLNPLSSDLNVLRQTLLFSGLEATAYNQNRKQANLKLYEFGRSYVKHAAETTVNKKYAEEQHLGLWISGMNGPEQWNIKAKPVDFYTLKGYVQALLQRLRITGTTLDSQVPADIFSQGISIVHKKKVLVQLGAVQKTLLKKLDVSGEVLYADFNWDFVMQLIAQQKEIAHQEVAKFPAVRRDLALLLDKKVNYQELEQLAYQAERHLLKEVNLFDIYEGDKIEAGKKSYALSFTLQDEQATLTDKQIEKVMEKLIKTFEEKTGAKVRA